MNKYYKLLSKYIEVNESLTDEQFKEREHCEKSLYNFVTQSWRVIQGRPFIPSWSLGAVSEHLEALWKGHIRYLIINLPPRCGKSIVASVCLPAAVWAQDPNLRFLYSSYAQILASKDSVACRRLITSEWYQTLWGHKFALMKDVNNKLRFDNDKGGYRITSSVGGSNTGFGADILVADDPNNVKIVESEISRTNVNDWWSGVMTTRSEDFMTDRRCIIQQRTHFYDLSGDILSREDPDIIHLYLPMEFEKNNRCITIPLPSSGGYPWRDPRMKEGELLCPERIDEKALDKIKSGFDYDTYRIAGQLQQRPSPAGGGMFKRDWFQLWKEKDYPDFEFVLQSWDTALTSNVDSCYSACTTWGVFEDKGGIKNLMLLSVFREKIEYPDLRKMATRLAANYEDVYMDEPMKGNNKPHLILIEAKVSGYSLLQDLMLANLPVYRFDPNKHGDKIGRARIVSHLIENGLVWLPTQPPKFKHLTEDSKIFMEAAEFFPKGDGADVIDSMSQAFIHMKNSGWVYNKEDPQPEKQEVWQNVLPYY